MTKHLEFKVFHDFSKNESKRKVIWEEKFSNYEFPSEKTNYERPVVLHWSLFAPGVHMEMFWFLTTYVFYPKTHKSSRLRMFMSLMALVAKGPVTIARCVKHLTSVVFQDLAQTWWKEKSIINDIKEYQLFLRWDVSPSQSYSIPPAPSFVPLPPPSVFDAACTQWHCESNVSCPKNTTLARTQSPVQ